MRAISLLPGGTEILFALGIEPLGVSHECDYPPAALALPKATFSHVDSAASSGAIDDQVRQLLAAGEPLYGLDVNLIARSQPEVIVTQAQCDVCAVRYADVVRLVASRPELKNCRVVDLNPASLDDVLVDVVRVGTAVGRERSARELAAALRGRIDSNGWNP